MGEEVSVPPDEETEFTNRFQEEWVDKHELESQNLTFNLEQVAFYNEIHIYQVFGTEKS